MYVKTTKKIILLNLMLVWAALFSSYAGEVVIKEIGIDEVNFIHRSYHFYKDFHHLKISEEAFVNNAKQGLATGNYHILCAIKDDEVVGLISYSQLHELYWGSYLHIDSLVVDEHHRNQKIGKLLMDAVKEQGKKLTSKKICLETAFDNLGAQRLYTREGFTQRAIEYGLDPSELP
jgi:ribosomal protein S18 acetylase RimI-like enzyme